MALLAEDPIVSQENAPEEKIWAAQPAVKYDRPKRLNELEGMRGFAALMVFMVHFNGFMMPLPGTPLKLTMKFLAAAGSTGVDLFFLLSGFLVYGHLIEKRPQYGAYLTRRIRRLYPTFIVVLAIYVVISLMVPSASKLPGTRWGATVYILENVAMLPGMTSITPLITVAWSLSYEWFFYLTIPVIIMALRLDQRSRGYRLAVAITLAGICYGSRIMLFPVGIILWETIGHCRDLEKPRIVSRAGEIAAIGFVTAALAAIGLANSGNYTLKIVFAHIPDCYVILAASTGFVATFYTIAYDGMLKWFFSSKMMRWIGTISYSFYLTHGIVLHGVKLMLPGIQLSSPQSVIADFGISIAICLSVGGLTFVCVEKPLSIRKNSTT